MDRNGAIQKIWKSRMIPWDVVVIGGGASGLGAALEAATRGYKTLFWSRMILPKVPPAEALSWFMEE